MRLYYITDSYIDYLRQFDPRIYTNKNETRPYVGIVLQINNVSYYVCLSSPKPKHLKMHNTKDFRKVAGGKYGALNFNYMIPVPSTELIQIDIQTIQDVKYRRLLQNQFNAIKSDWGAVQRIASELYSLCTKSADVVSASDQRIIDRCCDFKFLEQKCLEYCNH